MKKSVMLVVLLLMSTLMFAQRGAYRGGHDNTKADPEAMATRRADRMKKALLLSDDQYAKIKAIYVKFGEGLARTRQDTTMTREASGAETKRLMDASETEVKAVLTPEQQTKLAELKKARRDRRDARHGKRGADDDADMKK